MQTKSINGGLSMNELIRLYKLGFDEFYEIRKHISDDEIDNFRKTADTDLNVVIIFKEVEYQLRRVKELNEDK